MIGYGMAKASVHHLTKTLAAPGSGLPTNCTAVAILPETLDTPMNRKWMPKADTSSWTSLDFVSRYFNYLFKNSMFICDILPKCCIFSLLVYS